MCKTHFKLNENNKIIIYHFNDNYKKDNVNILTQQRAC